MMQHYCMNNDSLETEICGSTRANKNWAIAGPVELREESYQNVSCGEFNFFALYHPSKRRNCEFT